MRLRAVISIAVLAFVVALPAPAALAAAGDLDTTYSGNGITSSGFYTGGFSVLVDATGRVIVGGSHDGRPSLVRYSTDGTLDPTFSGDGKMTLPSLGGVDELAWRNGKILALVGGTAFQVTTRGRIDLDYGDGDGRIQLPGTPRATRVDQRGVIYALFVGPDLDGFPGSATVVKIVGEDVVASVEVPRFDGGWPSGGPDYGGDRFADLALSPDGASLYVVGSGPSLEVSYSQVAVAMRYRTRDLAPAWPEPAYAPLVRHQWAIAVAGTTIPRNGKLLVLSQAFRMDEPSAGDWGVVTRVAPDGTVEKVIRMSSLYDVQEVHAIAVQDPKIVVFGSSGPRLDTGGDDPAWTVWRLTAQGAPDPLFGGGDGEVRTPRAGTDAWAGAVWEVPQPGPDLDRIVAVGGNRTVRYLA